MSVIVMPQPRIARQRLSQYLMPVLVLCWLLSEVCVNLPGRRAALDFGGLDALALAKLAIRVLSLGVLGFIVIRANMSARAGSVLLRCTPLLVYSLWLLATCFWSPIRPASAGHAVEALMLALLSIVIGIACRTERDLEILLLNIVLAITILISFLLVMNADFIAGGMRPTKYMQPNNMAGIASCGLITLLASRYFWRWRWTQKLAWPGGLICAAAIIAAQSRAALIVTFCLVLPLLWLLNKRTMLVFAVLPLGVLFAVWPYSQTVSHLPDTVEKYLMRGQTAEDAYTVSGRTELWDIAIESFLESPLFGHGYYSMTSTGKMYVWGAQRWQTAHNIYLHVLTGAGLMGFCLLAWALLYILAPLTRNLRARGHCRKVAVLVFMLASWYLTFGFFELSFAGPVDPEVVLFYVLLGIAAGHAGSAANQLATS